MAYEGPEYWYVIYKAVADFGDLMADAAKAKQELQSMADSVKAETAAEVAGATQAAQARKTDILAIQQESQALAQLANAAKNTNVQLLYGGRNDMQQHLSDMAQELQFTTLLNRQQWLGFSTVQQAVAYRQQMLQLALQENKARFGGYLTPDQWLGYLQKEVAAYSTEAAAIRARAAAIQTETSAMLSYDNAVQGAHVSIGQLGEGISAASGYAAALTGLPDEVVTRLSIDDTGAMAQIAAYRAALGAIPGAESSRVITSSLRAGGVPLSAQPRAEVPGASAWPSLLPPGEPEEVDALGAALAELAAREAEAAAPAMILREALEADGEAAAVLAAELAALAAAEDSLGGGGARTGFRTAGGAESVGKEIAIRYAGELEAIPAEIVTEAEFDDTQATDELHAWVGDLVAAMRDRYAFYAQFDDSEMLEKLNEDTAKIKAAAAGWEGDLGTFSVLGMGGGAGGGGGGAPPPAAAAAPGGDDEAAKALIEDMIRLNEAEKETGDQADITAAEFLKMASAAESGAKAYAYVQAAAIAADIAQGEGNEQARQAAQDFLNLAGGADSGTRAYAYVRAAAQAMAAAQDTANDSTVKAGGLFQWISPIIAQAGTWWFGLNAQLAVFGGQRLPGILGLLTIFGTSVAAWHVALDAVIEVLAFLIPALATLALGIGAFILVADLAQDTLGRIHDRAVAVYQAFTATGQAIYPLTGQFDSLGKSIRPQVWQLLGDALTLANGNMGMLGQAALKTGSVLDSMAAKIVVWFQSSAKGIQSFFAIGAHDLSQLGTLLSTLGNAFINLIRVTQDTHVDQIFLAALIVIAKLIDLVTKLPTPLLAAVIGLHAFWLWGGLLATILSNLVAPLRAVALALGGVSAESTALAELDSSAGGLTRLRAALSDVATGFGAMISKIGQIGPAVRSAVSDTTAAAGGTGAAADAEAAAGVGEGALVGEATASGTAVGEAAAAGVVAGFDSAAVEENLSKGFSESFFDKISDITVAFGTKIKSVIGAVAGVISSVPADLEAAASKVSSVTGHAAEDLIAFAQSAEAGGMSVEDLARSTTKGAALVEQYGKGLEGSSAQAVAMAAALGRPEEEVAKVASAEEEGAAKTGLFGGALASLGPILTQLGLIGAAIAVGIFIDKIVTARDATQQWIDSVNQDLSTASLFTVIGKTVSDLAATTQQLSNSRGLDAQATHELTGAQSQLSGQLQQELVHTGAISKAYGVDMPTALGLMNMAGVTTNQLFTTQNKVWADAQQQVAGMITGYRAMGQGLTQLQGDVSVQLVTQADQLASMQKLNTAWDQWLALVDGGESTFTKLQQDLGTTATAATQTGASMTGLNTNSIALRSAFIAMIPDAGNVLDAIRSQTAVLEDGAQGSALLTRATRDLAAEMIPLAGNNTAARSSLVALVEEADPSISTWQKLTQWVGKQGAAGAAADLQTVLFKLAAPVSQLAQDAAKLNVTLQQDLNPAMAAAEFAAMGGQGAFNAFAADLTKFGPGAAQTISSGRVVAEMLLSIDKNSTTAKTQFVAWAETMGLSAKQADALWGSVSKGVKPMQDIRQGLASSATASDNLDKSGFFAGIRDRYAQHLDQMATWFGTTLPHAMANVGVFASHMWSGAYEGFERDIGSPVAHWFTTSFPAFFTQSIPAAWDKAWSELGAPVVRAFDAVKHAITSGFDQWWAGHGHEIMQTWDAVTSDIVSGAEGAGRQLEQWAKVLWDHLASIFHSGGGPLQGAAKAVWGSIAASAEALWTSILEPLFKAGWSVITGIFRIAAGTVEAIGKGLWDTLASAAQLFWAGLQAAAKLGWDTIVAIFSVALDLITGHWSQAWADIKNYGEQAWHVISNFYTSAWSIFRNDFDQTLNLIKSAWSNTWDAIRTAAEQVWGDIKTGAANVVTALKNTWSSLEGIFKAPVSFLVNTVYDNGIAALWNDVMGAIGGPKLPIVKFAGGGQIPGYGGGDIVPAWIRGGGPALLEPGEAVIDKERTRKYSGVLKAMGVPGFQGGGSVPGGGVLHDIGSFFSGAGHDLVSVLGDAIDIGKIGAALITGNTTALANALEKFIGAGGATAELAPMITGIPKTIIKQLVSEAEAVGKKAASALSAPGVGGSAGAGVQTVARYIMAHGGTKEAGAGVGGVVSGESGGNPEIYEFPNDPGRGGAGILQWTPPSSAAPYQPIITGNVGRDMATQLADMIAYINGRGGIGAINAAGAAGGPMGAAREFSAMEAPLVPGSDIVESVVMSLYAQGLASGGEVRVPYLAGMSAGRAHNVLVAAGLVPRADAGQKPSWWVSSSSPAGDASVSPHYGVWINASASAKRQGLKVPDLRGYDAGTAHNILAAMGLTPTAPAGQKATWQVTGTKPGYNTGTGYGAHIEIEAAAPKTPGPVTAPGGLDSAQSWSYYAGKLTADANAQKSAFWNLYNAKLPTGKGKATAAQAANWVKDKAAMWSAQTIVGKDRDALLANLSNPAQMTSAQWGALGPALAAMKDLEYGTKDPSWNWPAWKYEFPLWQAANASTKTMQTDVAAAYAAWLGTYGPGGPSSGSAPASEYTTPGVLVTLPGGTASPVSLASLIVGGPAAARYAGGGLVGADLGQVAGMFGMGGPSRDPALASLGLASGLQRQLVTATGGGGMPRTLAQGAGDRIGVKIGSLTISNPVAEKPSDTIARSTNRLAFLAGRGPV